MSDALVRVADALAALTKDGHLREPGTVIYTRDHVSILPENWGAPISDLLTWAAHLDGPVHYDAAPMVWDTDWRPTTVRAHGHLNGVEVVISATTPKTLPQLNGVPSWQNVKVPEVDLHELALRELSNDEVVVTESHDLRPNRSEWTSAHTWRDPDCIECGGEGAPCCEPPDTPVPAEMRDES